MKYVKFGSHLFPYVDGYILVIPKIEGLDKISQAYSFYGDKKVINGDLWVKDTEVFVQWRNLKYEIIDN